MNKDDLLQAIHECHDAIEACCAAATEAQLTCCPGPQTDWSIKDLIAHLTYWEQDMLARVGSDALGVVPDSEVDAVNARVYETNKDRPLAAIQADFRRSLEQIDALVGGLSDADLNSTERMPLPNQIPLWQYIADETYEHYRDDHLPDVRAWAQRERVLL
jgi:hypothetical protein